MSLLCLLLGHDFVRLPHQRWTAAAICARCARLARHIARSKR